MGEFNRATAAGFWGWPYSRGNNQPYNDYDFETEESGPKFDPARLRNNSPNNTGLEALPPAQESFIWYSFGKSEEFPWLGFGGVNLMAGPLFHSSSFGEQANTFPVYFENTLFLYEWMRHWIYTVKFDENGEMIKVDPFMANEEFSRPMDMVFGKDGKLYMIE